MHGCCIGVEKLQDVKRSAWLMVPTAQPPSHTCAPSSSSSSQQLFKLTTAFQLATVLHAHSMSIAVQQLRPVHESVGRNTRWSSCKGQNTDLEASSCALPVCILYFPEGVSIGAKDL